MGFGRGIGGWLEETKNGHWGREMESHGCECVCVVPMFLLVHASLHKDFFIFPHPLPHLF